MATTILFLAAESSRFCTKFSSVLGPSKSRIPWVPETYSEVVKQPGREADQPPLSRTDVQNDWSCTSTPSHAVMSWCLIKHCGSFLLIYVSVHILRRGPRWSSWLRHCATSQKVAGSIPDGVIGIFHWHNPSGRTMALGSTQPLTEISTGNISWG